MILRQDLLRIDATYAQNAAVVAVVTGDVNIYPTASPTVRANSQSSGPSAVVTSIQIMIGVLAGVFGLAFVSVPAYYILRRKVESKSKEKELKVASNKDVSLPVSSGDGICDIYVDKNLSVEKESEYNYTYIMNSLDQRSKSRDSLDRSAKKKDKLEIELSKSRDSVSLDSCSAASGSRSTVVSRNAEKVVGKSGEDPAGLNILDIYGNNMSSDRVHIDSGSNDNVSFVQVPNANIETTPLEMEDIYRFMDNFDRSHDSELLDEDRSENEIYRYQKFAEELRNFNNIREVVMARLLKNTSKGLKNEKLERKNQDFNENGLIKMDTSSQSIDSGSSSGDDIQLAMAISTFSGDQPLTPQKFERLVNKFETMIRRNSISPFLQIPVRAVVRPDGNQIAEEGAEKIETSKI